MGLPPDVCPHCGGPWIVVDETPSVLRLQCEDCQRVERFDASTKTVRLQLIVSAGDRSFREPIEAVPSDELRVGDEFEHNGHRLLITALQGARDEKPKEARAADVRAIHARLFDTVPLKLSVNEGETTRSYQIDVLPEFELAVGQVVEAQGVRLVVKTLKSDQNRTLHKGFLLARNIRRAFCDPAPRRAKVGEIVKTRPRGARDPNERRARHGPPPGHRRRA